MGNKLYFILEVDIGEVPPSLDTVEYENTESARIEHHIIMDRALGDIAPKIRRQSQIITTEIDLANRVM